jgi:hypothetical protein
MEERTRGDLLPRTQSTSTEPTADVRCGNRPTCRKGVASRVPKGVASVGFQGAEPEKRFLRKNRTFLTIAPSPHAPIHPKLAGRFAPVTDKLLGRFAPVTDKLLVRCAPVSGG